MHKEYGEGVEKFVEANRPARFYVTNEQLALVMEVVKDTHPSYSNNYPLRYTADIQHDAVVYRAWVDGIPLDDKQLTTLCTLVQMQPVKRVPFTEAIVALPIPPWVGASEYDSIEQLWDFVSVLNRQGIEYLVTLSHAMKSL